MPSPSPVKAVGISGTAKRVSINTPHLHEGSDHTAAAKSYVRTPFAKSSCEEPEAEEEQCEFGMGEEAGLSLDLEAAMDEQQPATMGDEEAAATAEQDAAMLLAASMRSARPTNEDVQVAGDAMAEDAQMGEPSAACTPMASAAPSRVQTPLAATAAPKSAVQSAARPMSAVSHVVSQQLLLYVWM
jgi:hypothetical protein